MNSKCVFNSETAKRIKAGDELRVQGLWNKTTNQFKLPVPVRVIEVCTDRPCQTGILVKVKTIGGQARWLSAGWFYDDGVGE